MKQNSTAAVLLFPLLTTIVLLTFVPLVHLVYFSFTGYSLVKPDFTFALTVRNYAAVLRDPDFLHSLTNTLLFFLAKTTFGLLCAFPAALALAAAKKNSLQLALFFLPIIVPVSAVAVVWLWFYDPVNGFFNVILRFFSLPSSGWLYNEKTALLSVVWFAVWKNLGYTVFILFIGLQSIGLKVLEAAKIDGASDFRILYSIIVPLLRAFFAFAIFTGAINSLRTFSETNVLTPNDGPLNSTLLISNYIYNSAFKFGQIAPASAAAVLFFVGFLLFMLVVKPQSLKKARQKT